MGIWYASRGPLGASVICIKSMGLLLSAILPGGNS